MYPEKYRNRSKHIRRGLYKTKGFLASVAQVIKSKRTVVRIENSSFSCIYSTKEKTLCYLYRAVHFSLSNASLHVINVEKVSFYIKLLILEIYGVRILSFLYQKSKFIKLFRVMLKVISYLLCALDCANFCL